ncbi:competence-specific global transcription modulator [Streptococcus pneumoniae]|nr:competence-specific global transcription modulator [Streptococcus pneumoniae]
MIKELYEEVQGTVYKCRNEYYLHLWELSDWDQEGMLCLHELISREEGLVDDIPRLRKYFKTKFRNRILDYIRKQESQNLYRNKQSKEKQEELERVLSNERFRGRQRVLRDLRIVFKEFTIRTH